MADLTTSDAITFINDSKESEVRNFKNGEIPADYVITKRYVSNTVTGELFYKIFITDIPAG